MQTWACLRNSGFSLSSASLWRLFQSLYIIHFVRGPQLAQVFHFGQHHGFPEQREIFMFSHLEGAEYPCGHPSGHPCLVGSVHSEWKIISDLYPHVLFCWYPPSWRKVEVLVLSSGGLLLTPAVLDVALLTLTDCFIWVILFNMCVSHARQNTCVGRVRLCEVQLGYFENIWHNISLKLLYSKVFPKVIMCVGIQGGMQFPLRRRSQRTKPPH